MTDDARSQSQWRPHAAAVLQQPLVLTVLLIAGTFAVLPSTFESNDDAGIVSILSGGDGFPASPDTGLLSPCFSRGLFALYGIAPAIPWYGLCWLVTIAFASFLMFSVIVDQRVEPVGRLAYATAALPLSMFWISRASYTSAAMATICAALVFVFRDATQRRANGHTYAMLAIAMLMAYPWRPGLVLAVIPLVAPCLLYLPRAGYGLVLAAFAPMTALAALDAGPCGFGRDPATEQFIEFNAARSAFHDTRAGDLVTGSERALAAAGWTAADYLAFRSIWQIHDEKIFNTATIRAFLTANAPLQASQPAVLPHGFNIALALQALQPIAPIVVPPLTLLGIAWRQSGGARRMPRWRSLAVVGFTMAAFAGLAAYRFMPRVGFPLTAWLVGTVAMLPPAMPRPIGPCFKMATIASVLVSIGGAVSMFSTTASNDFLMRQHRRAFLEGIHRHFAEFMPRPIVLVNPQVGLFPLAEGPFGRRRLGDRCRFIPCGWAVHSPRYKAALDSLGISSGGDLMVSPDVLFLATGSEQMIGNALRTWVTHINQRMPKDAPACMLIESSHAPHPYGGHVFFRVTTSPAGQKE